MNDHVGRTPVLWFYLSSFHIQVKGIDSPDTFTRPHFLLLTGSVITTIYTQMKHKAAVELGIWLGSLF